MRTLAGMAAAVALFVGIARGAEGAFPGKSGSIAFVGRGEKLFSIRADGSGLRRLTHGREDDRAPGFSPDGEQLVFVRGLLSMDRGTVFVSRSDGTRARRIFADASSAAWSPDGATIAVARYDSAVTIITPTGSLIRRIAVPVDRITHVAWSPDGRRLAVLGRGHANRLYTVDLGGRNLRVVVEEPEGTEIWSADWSPDGKQIAYHQLEDCNGSVCGGPDFLVVVDRGGSDKRRIAREGWAPAWSPDGKWLAFGNRGMLTTLRVRDGATSVVAAAGRGVGWFEWQPLCTHRGGRGKDRLTGRASDDLVCGLDGDDTIIGGRGSDRLFGESGNDRFRAKDGEFDVVGCGNGRDTVLADRIDRVARDCERVSRR